MMRHTPNITTFDRDGMRRVAARMLDLGHPASRQDAERLLAARLGPYGLERGLLDQEISTYFASRH